MMLKKLVIVGVAAFYANALHAEVVEIRITNPTDSKGSYFFFGPDVYLNYQNDFIAGGFDDPISYDFRFTYDPTSASPDYDFNFVSGRLGSYTDFSAFEATMNFVPNASLNFDLRRRDQITGTLSYTSEILFRLIDDDGQFSATPPTTLDFASLDTSRAEFAIRRAGGVGTGYKISRIGGSEGLISPLNIRETPGAGVVPEPGTWAMLVIGFGIVGTSLRRRRVLAA